MREKRVQSQSQRAKYGQNKNANVTLYWTENTFAIIQFSWTIYELFYLVIALFLRVPLTPAHTHTCRQITLDKTVLRIAWTVNSTAYIQC